MWCNCKNLFFSLFFSFPTGEESVCNEYLNLTSASEAENKKKKDVHFNKGILLLFIDCFYFRNVKLVYWIATPSTYSDWNYLYTFLLYSLAESLPKKPTRSVMDILDDSCLSPEPPLTPVKRTLVESSSSCSTPSPKLFHSSPKFRAEKRPKIVPVSPKCLLKNRNASSCSPHRSGKNKKNGESSRGAAFDPSYSQKKTCRRDSASSLKGKFPMEEGGMLYCIVCDAQYNIMYYNT